MHDRSTVKEEIALKKGCRTCLNQKPDQQTLFYEDMEVNVSDMLRECASIIVYPGDGLPTGICKKCLRTLRIAYEFKLRCQKTDNTLKGFLKLKIEKEEKELQHIATETSENNTEATVEVAEATVEVTEAAEVEVKSEEITEITNTEQKCRSEEEVLIETENSCRNLKETQNRITYDCEKCNKSFIRFSNLKIHLLTHSMTQSSSSDSSCNQCSMFFPSAEDLEAHNRRVHKFHSCKLCDRQFKSFQAVSYHVASYHNDQRPFPCSHPGCSKSYACNSALERHMLLHRNVKDYLCNICGKGYSKYDSWNYHMKQHVGKRKHLCPHCGKTFIQLCHLKSHMWVHTGVKPHICSSCGKGFTRETKMKRHMKNHCEKSATQVETIGTTVEEIKEGNNDVIVIELENVDEFY